MILSATLTARYLGPSPLTQDGLVSSDANLDTNFLIRYRWGRFSFHRQILNLLNNSDDDIHISIPHGCRRTGKRNGDLSYPPHGAAHLALGLRVTL